MYIFLILAITIVVLTVTQGIIKFYKGEICEKGRIKKVLRINMYSFIPVLTGLIITLIPQAAHAAVTGSESGSGLGFIAAGLSTGLAAIGAGYAVGAVGSSALGAVSEDPKILGKTLIFVGLAEGIAIYGLIISIMILGRL
ncbi:ATPase [Fervidicella metallireducens AeB]|uniref:ATPase n=1 Tax=Fervidicella metallireducens AeB TaxID=1403537 RepID=A0A017RWL2_9CLOT|nr:ATP synthase subunit C [Fervidicella metallireducens]EYE88976.1 ATPase [Fervidicella metallireducens AeB]